MLEETPIFRRHRRLDEVVRNLLKRHGIRELDAPLSDLVSIAIEDRHAEFAAGAPVRVFGKLDGGQLEHQHHSSGRRSKS